MPEKIAGDPFRLSLFLGIENIMLKRVDSRFLSQTFCLMVPKDIVGEPFCAMIQQISGFGKVYR